jgi:hypothetical protein
VVHLAAVVWGFAVIAASLTCPLTVLEDDLRRRGGQPGVGAGGFIDHYIEGVVYPERYTAQVRVLVAVLVVVSWLGVYLRRRGELSGQKTQSRYAFRPENLRRARRDRWRRQSSTRRDTATDGTGLR